MKITSNNQGTQFVTAFRNLILLLLSAGKVINTANAEILCRLYICSPNQKDQK